jgi:hypothetical protein
MMKILNLIVVATIQAATSLGQSIQTPSCYTPPVLASDFATLASIQNSQSYIDYAAFKREVNPDAKCAKYKKMKTVGIALSAVGGGLLITGIALDVIGVADASNNTINGTASVGSSINDAGMIIGGGVCITFGVLGAGAGIPLAVIGSKKSKQWCGGRGAYLSTRGNGLALNF